MSASKVAKTIAFTAQASNSHTATKIKNVLRWLKSGHEVRVQISGKADRQKAMDAIYKDIENEVKSSARFLQRVVKPESIKVILRPTEVAADIEISDTKGTANVDEEINEIIGEKDIFSEEFEKDLMRSIRDETTKNKKGR